jgi:hypothetical protein
MKFFLYLVALGLLVLGGTRGWDALESASARPSSAGPRVIVYLDPADPAGREAEAFFRNRGLDVEVRNVMQSAPAHAEYVRLGGGPLPLIRVGPERLNGFDRHTAERVLDRLERRPLIP